MPPQRTAELFPQSNFILSTNATGKETHDFLSSIRAVLANRNPWFEAELVPPPIPADPPAHGRNASVHSQKSDQTFIQAKRDRFGESGSGGASRPGTGKSENEDRARSEWEGYYDSEEDDIDRILMPIIPRRVHRKGNSRKALKWLGLA
jgi:hypothetical protein